MKKLIIIWFLLLVGCASNPQPSRVVLIYDAESSVYLVKSDKRIYYYNGCYYRYKNNRWEYNQPHYKRWYKCYEKDVPHKVKNKWRSGRSIE